ncbi:protein kinase family protein [Flindersiella endophytica]
MDSAARRARYSKVSAALAQLDDAALGDLLRNQKTPASWGTTTTVEVAGERVFVKLLPLTDLERGCAYSTSNHYDLPLFYQYGVGSAGFGTWRELVAHIRTTNWVLEGTNAAFPVMYHHRVVERPARADLPSQKEQDDYLRNWNSSQAIGRFMTERVTGTHQVAVFLEHLPYGLGQWLTDHPEDLEPMLSQLCETVTFLRGHGIVHFDAHVLNVVTDGELAYLTDFGLASDSEFDLTDEERDFLKRHEHYDYGVVLSAPWMLIHGWYHALPPEEQESVRTLLGAGEDQTELIRLIVSMIERLDGLVKPAVFAATVRYRDITMYMLDFFTRLDANPRKDTAYDDKGLADLLRTSGVLPG